MHSSRNIALFAIVLIVLATVLQSNSVAVAHILQLPGGYSDNSLEEVDWAKANSREKFSDSPYTSSELGSSHNSGRHYSNLRGLG